MHVYRLRYLEDFDDALDQRFESPSPVEVGDLIQLPAFGFHHRVLRIEEASSPAPLLVLGKSGQGPADADWQTLHAPRS